MMLTHFQLKILYWIYHAIPFLSIFPQELHIYKYEKAKLGEKNNVYCTLVTVAESLDVIIFSRFSGGFYVQLLN